MQTYARLATLLCPHRGRILLALLCTLIASSGFLALPLILKDCLGISPTLGEEPVTPNLVLQILVAVIAFSAAMYGSVRIMYEVGFDLEADLRRRYLKQLLHVPMGYHRETSAGDLMDRLTTLTQRIGRFVRFGLGTVLGLSFVMAGGIFMLFWISWQLAILVGISSALIILGLRAVDRRAQVRNREGCAASERMMGLLHEVLLGIEVVKAFNAQVAEVHRFEQRQDRWVAARKSEASLMALMEPGLIAAGLATFLGVLLYSGHLRATGELTADKLTAFVLYLLIVLPSTRNLVVQWAGWRDVRVALDRLDKTLAIPPEQDAPNAREMPVPTRGQIEFRRVTHHYDERYHAIENLSFLIRPGECVGVVGESGVGKTTLFNLLLRFYQPQQGNIQIDGWDIQQLTLASLRANIAVVPQDIVLFDDTVLENVRYGRPGASEEETRAACRAAQATEFIEALPEGYRTVVGGRGVKLSGGQRQRLALARALLKNAPILLLDEATSSLDTQTERQLREVMQVAVRDRTTLIIAHRLATVAHLPRILVLGDGRVLDDGSHDDLIRRCEAYRNLVAHQLMRDEPLESPTARPFQEYVSA